MAKQRRNLIILWGVLFGMVLLAAFGAWQWKMMSPTPREPLADEKEKIRIVATFYPLEDVAHAVGGDLVSVRSVVPAGREPHEYEPTVQDIIDIYEADLVLINGAGLDPWAEKLKPELEARGITVLLMADIVSLLPAAETEEPEPGASDPHFWLDPFWVEREAETLRDALIARDRRNAALYQRNTEEYIALLAALDRDYREGTEGCAQHTIVTSHQAFSYLAQRYGFGLLSVSGISPDEEASPRSLVEMTERIRSLGVKHIFFETLASPDVAETLATEAGVQTLVLNPIEGLTEEDRRARRNYLSIMRDNLDNLKIALQCPL